MIKPDTQQQIIRLGGRDFVPVLLSTIEHDYWLMATVRAAGLDQITKADSESPEDFVHRILHEVIVSGEAFNLLGGLLIDAVMPVQAWTPDIAMQTADFIKHLTAPEDKAAVQAQMIALLLGFFENGLTSVMISPKSSGEMEREARTEAA